MKLSALLLTLAIALGLAAPLEARNKKPKKAKPQHYSQKAKPPKAPKVKTKPAKVKPMKFHKAKNSHKSPKVPKVRPKST